MASTTTASANMRRRLGMRRPIGDELDAKALPLASHGAPEVLELRLDHVVDRLAGPAEILGDLVAVIRHMLPNLVARNAIPHLTAALRRPTRADGPGACRLSAGPRCTTPHTFHYRHHWSATGRSAPQHECQSGANRHPDQRGGQKVVLGVTLAAGFAGADGHAGLLA